MLLQTNTITITGTVFDEDGDPIPGVIVKVEEYPDIATLTDFNGHYELKNIPDDAKKLIFSFTGMETQIIKIKHDTVINVTMTSDNLEIDEVVVTSLGIKKHKGIFRSSKRDLTYSADYDDGGSLDFSDADFYDASDRASSNDNNINSGQLTAGEVNDFGKWEMWQDITNDQLKQFKTLWQIYPKERYCVLLTSENNSPIIDATVYLKSDNKTIWTAKTDNTGKAELWANMFDSTNLQKISIQIDYKGNLTSINNPSVFQNGINKMTLQTVGCNIPNEVDIAFVFDATGSMGDEMRYLQAEILDVIKRIDSSHSDLTINLGSVFYRDVSDNYLTKKDDLTTNITSAISFFSNQTADGGGDFPEAVHSGLNVAINQLSWHDNARTRIIFLVLDAPPHNQPKVIDSLRVLTQQAAAKGIRIIPITCSGVDKSTEYLMRSMALATNGTYVFLTDDSGIGGSHIKPTTDKWDVEFLNDLIVRLVNQYIVTPDCSNQIIVDSTDIQQDTVLVNYPAPEDTTLSTPDPDTNIAVINSADTITIDTTANNPVILPKNKLKVYPNPTSGNITVEISGNIEEFYICDYSGKILQRQIVDGDNELRLDIGMYPNGIYFVRYFIDNQLKSGKIILMQ